MTEPVALGAALLAGLLGSGHCVGMCGPMATLPRYEGAGRTAGMVVYNTGRLASYALAGALAGGLGAGLGEVLNIAAWADLIRVVLGAVVALLGLQLLLPRFRYNPITAAGQRLGALVWPRLAPIALKLRGRRGLTPLFSLGVLWGWLPCGLVYSLLAAAAASGGALAGAGVLGAFWLGTLPAMLGLSLASAPIRKKLTVRPVMGAALLVSGLWISAMPLYHLNQAGSEGGHAHHAHHHQMP